MATPESYLPLSSLGGRAASGYMTFPWRWLPRPGCQRWGLSEAAVKAIFLEMASSGIAEGLVSWSLEVTGLGSWCGRGGRSRAASTCREQTQGFTKCRARLGPLAAC